MSLLAFEGVRKCYPDGSRAHVVLDDVSFEIETGDTVGVWGPRHSGKSTLLRIAAGIQTPDDDKIFFDGLDVTRLRADKRVRALRNEIGFVSANWRHYNRLAGKHVAFAATADGRTTFKRAQAMARRALKQVDVLECADRHLDGLSMGERIRVELARALVRKPRLLIVDEPPPLHNPHEGDNLYDLLVSLGNDADRALLLASGDATLVQQTQRMMHLSRGRLTVMAQPPPATVHHLKDRRASTKPA